jgi:hypothetical protein
VFAYGDGLDVVTDFVAGGSSGDLIDLHGYGLSTFAQLQAFLSQSGANVLINFDAGNQITLQNVQLSQLKQNDFLLS